MREIKFRAWDIEAKKMLSWEDLRMMPACFFLERPDLYEPLEYTGLHDKNDKEIYKGGKIKSYNPIKLERGEKADYTGIVSWSNVSLAWVLIDDVGQFIDMLCRVEQPEIIGTIHDTPEQEQTKPCGPFRS